MRARTRTIPIDPKVLRVENVLDKPGLFSVQLQNKKVEEYESPQAEEIVAKINYLLNQRMDTTDENNE